MKEFENNKKKRMMQAEDYILDEFGPGSKGRFIPKMLIFEPDGRYALLCDDNEDPDEGIAVILGPRVIYQSDYL